MEDQQEQQQPQYKSNNKGSHKEFNRWMVNEIEDFFPEITPEDPLKRFYHLLDRSYSTSLPNYQRKRLVIAKHPKPTKTLKHGPNFSISKYWKQFSSQVSEILTKFLDLKDIIMMVYTCKYFKEELDQESMWKILKGRDFFSLRFQMLLDDAKDKVSEKLYYKYLYLSTVSGIPYQTGYFKNFGSPDVVELSDSIVDFLCPKSEMVKKYAGEILMRNECRSSDLKLSWVKEKKEIYLWNGNASLEYKKPENGNEEVETINKFYPCFIKRYSMVDEDEEIEEVFFLEDKYLVVKIQKKEEEAGNGMTIFRILNLEEELYSIAKGLEPALPFDYSFMLRDDGDNLVETIRVNEFGVDFVIDQEAECDVKVKLLLGDRAVFYTESSKKPTMIFWDLKEKKKIACVSVELKKLLSDILLCKKSEVATEKLKLFILDESMNVYCGSLSEKEGFVLNQTIIISTSAEQEKEEEMKKQQEKDVEKLKEFEAKRDLNFGKKTRSKYPTNRYSKTFPTFDSAFDFPTKLDSQFREKTRRYYHEVSNKTNEEWLVVSLLNNFHFINLDEGKIHEFSSDKDISLASHGNWNIYQDNLVITNPKDIFYYNINFEKRSISFRFSREIKNLSVQDVGNQWIFLDPCFTVLIFTHMCELGFTTKATIVVTSTQEFLYNQDPTFNLIPYKVQSEHFFRATHILRNKDRNLNIKFENSKVLVGSERASFYFDMNLSAEPYNKVYLNGWMSNTPIHIFGSTRPVTAVRSGNEIAGEEETGRSKQKMVNYMKLTGNPNTMNAKEKNNGWKKGGKSQAKREEDQEYKVMKGKGEKYHKNIRQGQRSEKAN